MAPAAYWPDSAAIPVAPAAYWPDSKARADSLVAYFHLASGYN